MLICVIISNIKALQLQFSEIFCISKAHFAGPTIYRKIGPVKIENSKLLEFWKKNYEAFIEKINNQRFATLIFDFDGTLCSNMKRYSGVDEIIQKRLLMILQKGFIIGISTGRGKSVRENLQSFIPVKYYDNVFVSYYNGSETGTLWQSELPDLKRKKDDSILNSYKVLKSKLQNYNIKLELRPSQLTVEINNLEDCDKLKPYIVGIVRKCEDLAVQILESDHSLDIIPKKVSKLSIIDFCRKREKQLGIEGSYLCFGDKGLWPGNDYKLLSTELSLSVDEVSLDESTCWNIASVGLSNVEATNEYLEKIRWFYVNLCGNKSRLP